MNEMDIFFLPQYLGSKLELRTIFGEFKYDTQTTPRIEGKKELSEKWERMKIQMK